MNLAALLEKSARRFGDRPALALGHELFSSYQNTAEQYAFFMYWVQIATEVAVRYSVRTTQ